MRRVLEGAHVLAVVIVTFSKVRLCAGRLLPLEKSPAAQKGNVFAVRCLVHQELLVYQEPELRWKAKYTWSHDGARPVLTIRPDGDRYDGEN